MPQVRIKLNADQLKKLESLLKKPTRKSWKITIKHEDILAGSKSPMITTSVKNREILTTAYNLQKSATVELSRKTVLQLGRFHYPEVVIGNGLGAVAKIKQQKLPELDTTTEDQLMDYAEQLKIIPFAISCIDEPHPDIGIINSDTREGGGKHWTAVFIDDASGYNYIFDPFGVVPDQRILDQLDEKNDNENVWNTREIQDISESNCGQHCIRWLYSIFRTTRRFQEHKRFCTTAKTDLAKWWHKMGLPFD